ncbi:uncharacterized transmembrane protein DDB_G0289901 [Penaeus vannamei]|uniref:uncharacterized transmembrane protein DDB_G0289901 n=1 Tax=Penaeus vannamei TaxID=6689 RepID=UPI00387F66DB
MAARKMTCVFVFALSLSSVALGEETGCPVLENTHAVTEVLGAMNKLLSILANEVRELRAEVGETCTAKENDTLACAAADGGAGAAGVDEGAPLSSGHSLPDGGDGAADGENGTAGGEATADGENGTAGGEATSDGENGTAGGEATADGEGDADEGEAMSDADEGTAVPNASSEVPPSPLESVTVEATTIPTTTTTTEPLPPVPTSCPPSFTLEADGCYIFIYDEGNWRTWGEAHAFCQTYGGELASPYRLAPLQEYLDTHFTQTFWVGARLRDRMKFFWFNKKKVDKKTWKENHPSRHPNKKCVYLDKRSGYRATNFFCGEKYAFVCDYREA